MERLVEAFPLLVLPFVACLVIASLHCYMGLHVIRRGVIFVDLALAQCAALGAAVALIVTPLVDSHPHHHNGESPIAAVSESQLADQLSLEDDHAPVEPKPPAHATVVAEHHDHDDGTMSLTPAMSLFFALLGALLLSVARLRDERIPHEALIGIIFVVSAALTVLILSKAPHGHERMEAMLVGSILFVSWPQVTTMLAIYVVLGILHVALRRPIMRITGGGVAAAERAGVRVKLWDCLFYGSFALMVTQSVSIAGVFVVFSFLIIPAACASLFADRFAAQLILAWLVAVITTVFGLVLSAVVDVPTGASLVACFGAVLVAFAMARTLARKNHKGTS